MNYKELLAFQPTITPFIILVVDKLSSGNLTSAQFHNQKAYAKKKKDLTRVIEYTVAWEIANFIKGGCK